MITLVVLSAVAPGTAHIMRGRHRIGRLLVKGYLVLLTFVGLLLFFAKLSEQSLVELAVRPEVLTGVQYTALGIAITWCLVIVSGALIGGAATLAERQRMIVVVLVGVLCVIIASPLVVTARLASAQRGLIGAVFTDGAAPDDLPDRLNILLLGGDGAADRPGVRTDSVNLASIDTDSGATVMFSLPRNLQNVPFPPDSPLHELYPGGFDCGSDCLLNALHTHAAAEPGLFPDVRDPGAEALKQAVSATLGLDVHYYMLINMDGFADLVDALGGITIRVDERIPIGGITTPIRGYIEPGVQELDGYHALWYSRSRAESSDYERMTRQRCIMGAILDQADPIVVLQRYEKVASSAKSLVSTDIPRDLLPDLVDVAFKVRSQQVTNVQFVPPAISSGNPDFAFIQAEVAAAIAESAQPEEPPASPAPVVAEPDGTPSDPPAPAESGDPVTLDSVCAYR